MKDLRKRTALMMLVGIALISSGIVSIFGQEAELKSLSGRIRWKKSMGVLPKAPNSTEPAENICAQFYVVVLGAGSDKPYQYDIALEEKPEPSKPDYYSCSFEMMVPNKSQWSVHPGMGNGLAWPRAEQSRFHYILPWVDAGRPVRSTGYRAFSPAKRDVILGNKGLYITFELVNEGSEGTGQANSGTASLNASRTIFQSPYSPMGTAVVTWDAGQDHPNAELWVKYNNAGERVPLVKQPKGTQQIAIQRGLSNTYILVDGRIILATTVVVGN